MNHIKNFWKNLVLIFPDYYGWSIPVVILLCFIVLVRLELSRDMVLSVTTIVGFVTTAFFGVIFICRRSYVTTVYDMLKKRPDLQSRRVRWHLIHQDGRGRILRVGNAVWEKNHERIVLVGIPAEFYLSRNSLEIFCEVQYAYSIATCVKRKLLIHLKATFRTPPRETLRGFKVAELLKMSKEEGDLRYVEVTEWIEKEFKRVLENNPKYKQAIGRPQTSDLSTLSPIVSEIQLPWKPSIFLNIWGTPQENKETF